MVSESTFSTWAEERADVVPFQGVCLAPPADMSRPRHILAGLPVDPVEYGLFRRRHK